MRNRILFVGLANLDIINRCLSYPLEDSDQRAESQHWQRGGNASNNCTVFSQLMQSERDHHYAIEFLGTLSDDFAADFMRKDFEKSNILTDNVVIHNGKRSPISCVIISNENGSRTIVHYNKDLPELSFEDFAKINLDNYCLIHFEGRNIEMVKEMINHIRKIDIKRDIKVSLELEKPKLSLIDALHFDFDILFVEKDFAFMLNYDNINDTIKNISERVSQNAIVICPWGECGAKAINNKTKQMVSSTIFSPKNGVIDTLGAGDTFVAGTLFALEILKYNLSESITLGCRVAGAKCGFEGYDHINKYKDYIL